MSARAMIGRFFNSYFRFSYDDAQVRSLPSKTARPILGKSLSCHNVDDTATLRMRSKLMTRSTWMTRSTLRMRSMTDVQCYGMKIMIAGEFYCWLRTDEFSLWNFGDVMFLWEFLFLAGKFKTLSFLAVAWRAQILLSSTCNR